MPNIEGITVQKSNAERKSYVVVGAILSCSSGSQLSRLKMPFSHGVFVKGKPQMNIMDFVPNINIMPFGKCSSLKNPAVASATAANNGVLTPMPCTPVMTMPWMDGKPDKMVGGHPALLNKSTNMCFHCGLIKIEDDGQDLGGVTVGKQSQANNESVNANFEQGPACEKPQEKPSMWDHFVKGISKLGDVPAAMQKAASELPGALEKAANDLPRGLQKAAEDLPKGIGVFVREGYIEPMQEDLNTLRDDKFNLADGIALGGLALNVLTLGRSKNIKNVVDVARKKKQGKGKSFIDTKGYRNDTPLTQEQTDELVNYAKKLGFPEENIHIADSVNTTPTSIMYDTILIINNDVLPSKLPTKNPNSLISGKGTIAHEVVGHYETVKKGTAFNQYDLINNEMVLNPRNYALDEAQASIRAARFAPELSQAEKRMLIKDGIQRLRNANLKIKDVRHLLDIVER
ncbi:hypothetical protein AA984_12280 [Brevibacillus formosus]|uniref:DUF4280 domain-containing protein n=1 Tax=Brevibacillus formosus TaxID=54913 RepID=A0A837KQD7_9BACL|nr:hypothetical protein AA984_12280 [Brevibacillus formosus]GED57073.1 hypothetical protein BFO01nite_12050 [Brevibacillus formosus]